MVPKKATALLLLVSLAASHVSANLPLAATRPPWHGRRLSHRRLSSSSSSRTGLAFLDDRHDIVVQPCSATAAPSIGKTLWRGAVLRIASDLSGGTVLESIKTRVTLTREGPMEATRHIVKDGGSVLALWKGTPSRTIEGALIGALFMVGSAFTKAQCLKLGAPPTVAALAGGVVGGVMQSLAMTPAGMIFASLHANADDDKRDGGKSENAFSVTRRIVRENGFLGLYAGSMPMVVRQASNWASRAGFTEIARTTLGMSKYGLLGEIGSGVIGGVGSCWNTPIETIRVVTCRDVSLGRKSKKMGEYWTEIRERDGIPGLFRGVTPRALQAIWQTVFLVVVPNILSF